MVNNLGIIQLAILASCLMADDRPVSLDDRFTVDGCYRAAREKSQREREAKLKAAQRVQTAEERKQTQDRQAAVARVRAQYDIPDIPGTIECNDFDAMMRCLIKHTATLDQTRNDIAKAKKLLAINQKFQRAAGSIVTWRFIISSITPSDGTNPARAWRGLGPGRPGWSPTQAPHRSGLAHHAHPVPHLMNSRPARSVVVTWTWFRSQCTWHVSLQRLMRRHLLPSTGSLGLVPPLQRYYEVLRLPAAHFAALRFLRLAIPSLRPLFVPPGPGRGAVDQSGVGRRYLQPPGSMETTGSPKFPEEPL